MLRLLLPLLVFFAVLTGCTPTALPRIADVTSFFALGDSLLVYSEPHESLTLYEVQEGAFAERASITSAAVPHKAVVLTDRIIVAYGYGRGKLQDPIRIVSYDLSLRNPKELLMHSSERNQVAELIAVPERNSVFLSFFTSKYRTSAGWLHLQDGSFEESVATRLGMQYDVAGDLIVQGRPYGDAIGEDGDVTLFMGTGSQQQPSFRGVSEVKFVQLDDDHEFEILIADGWHQDYGTMAEPRVSLIDRTSTGSYALKMLAVLPPQYAVSTIHPFTLGQKRYLFTVGNSRVDSIDLVDRSVRNIYTSDDPFFDAVFLGQRGSTIDVAIKGENEAWLTSVEF